ncbi:protein phosphatase 2C [Heterostelium album PN500]|uniref:Protein phosphatase 2C n=1 Tax=Heterostelium pallidum (strain ATCC 26659 / Pp 5 / PN500) TaxID=670386 RepID=D3B9M8_HETP5|nr:protein phosphatase 2C [Heterostelium album PN500]EFA81940.1 protein phosphatase 2C [Heterostelium album PN500]|eukprot:XP_020434057.1 protein phosphatase 2C [Heterostelium album PN500]
MSLNLKTMILLVGAAGVAVFAFLMTYEFVELIINLMYTCVLMIVVAFFYQNQHNAKSIVGFLLDIQFDDSSAAAATGNKDKSTSTSSTDQSSSSSSPNQHSFSKLNGNIGQHRVGGVISSDSSATEMSSVDGNNNKRKSDKEIVAQLYEQIKDLNLQFFTERVNSDKEKLALQQLLKTVEAAATDANQERTKWKVAAEQQKAKNTELIKERDHLASLESRHQSKLYDYERKEKNWNDSEKMLVKKISEFKDTISQQKKDNEEKTKRIGKLEDQLAKLQKQLQINGVQLKELQVIQPSMNIGATISTSQPVLSSTPSKPIVVVEHSKQQSSSSSSLMVEQQPTTPATSSAIPIIQPSPGTSPNGGIQLPPPSIVTTSTITTISNTTAVSMNSNITLSSSNSANSLLAGIRDSSEDEDSSSSSVSSSPSGEAPKQLKNLFKKVKHGSTKIINKAQNHLNKQFHTDFFTPPTSSSPNKDRSDVERDIFEGFNTPLKEPSTAAVPKEKKVMFDANVEKEIFGNGTDIFKSLQQPSDNGADLTKNIPDIFTFDEESDNKSNEANEFSDLLTQIGVGSGGSSDLKFNFNETLISGGGGSSFISGSSNRSSTSSISSEDSLFSCIKEFSIKESENKAGLRRAKKKPLTPNANMMEDVSFGQFPFNNNSEIALFGVFDGHAGREAADFANTLFPAEIQRLINSKPEYLEKADMTDLFMTAFASVDNQMHEECQYVGCTATVSFIWTYDGSRYLQVANVGDSSSFLCRNGVAVEMTFDHKASHPLEKKRMIESGITVGEQQTRINGVAVSRSLGNHFIKDQNIGMIAIPHISKPILLQDSDTFLIMASDGLWDVISGEKAIEVGKELIESRGAQSVSSNLLQSALQMNDCKDNVTIITVKIY